MISIIKEVITSHYNDLDFPFYNENPRIPISGWIILFLSLVLGFFVYGIFDFSDLIVGAVATAIIFIPLLYYSKWDYSILLHMPTGKEILLAVIMFIGYILYSFMIFFIMEMFGVSITGNVMMDILPGSITSLIFGIAIEELVKFIPLMFFMRLFYKYSKNRKISFVFASIPVLVGFGLLHLSDEMTLLSVLLIQGLGSSFELFGYYKTKNLLVPYLSHLLTDILVEIVVLLV